MKLIDSEKDILCRKLRLEITVEELLKILFVIGSTSDDELDEVLDGCNGYNNYIKGLLRGRKSTMYETYKDLMNVTEVILDQKVSK